MKEKLFSITRKDFDVQTFCSGGPGGQHQNKTESGVRIVHRESRAVGESREEKSQHANRKIALRRLVESKTFKAWLNRKAHEFWTGITIDEIVEAMMASENLMVETKDERGRWVKNEEL